MCNNDKFQFNLFSKIGVGRDQTLEGATNQNDAFLVWRHSDWVFFKKCGFLIVGGF